MKNKKPARFPRMFLVKMACLFLLVCVSSSRAQAASWLEVGKESAFWLDRPSRAGDLQGWLAPGRGVELLGEQGEWRHVRVCADRDGWILAEHLQPVGPRETALLAELQKIRCTAATPLSRPSLKKLSPPEYPEEAEKTFIGGKVRARLWVGSHGEVQEIQILRGPGAGLNLAAMMAFLKSDFEPGRVDGHTIAGWKDFSMRFDAATSPVPTWRTEVADFPPAQMLHTATVKAQKSFTYVEPHKQAGVTGLLRQNRVVSVLQSSSDWSLIQLGNRIWGWIPDDELAPAPRQETPGIFKDLTHFSEAQVQPHEERAPSPVYPQDAVDLGLRGTIKIEALLDEKGRIQDMQIVKGLGYGCNKVVLEAIEEWRYTPAREKGLPIPVQMNIEFTLEIEGLREDSGERDHLGAEILEATPPVYPDKLKGSGIYGTVLLQVQVAKNGSPRKISVRRGVHPLLDKAAKKAVKQWKFRPKIVKNRQYEGLLMVEVPFHAE